MIYFFPIYVDEFELYFIPKIVRLASPIGYNTLKGPTSQGLHKIPQIHERFTDHQDGYKNRARFLISQKAQRSPKLLRHRAQSEQISCDDDVTLVLAPNGIAALIRIFSGNALGYVDFGCSPSTVRSFTKIYTEQLWL